MEHRKTNSGLTRRGFIATTGALAGASALGKIASRAHAQDDSTIRLAFIGCGGRGAGAVGNALSVKDQGPVELYTCADVSGQAIDQRLKALTDNFGEKVNVTDDRKFVGFDAYKSAIDLLRPGDVAICTTRAYIRTVHVEYAVSKGINVFMEKPFASDPGTLHRLLASAKVAEETGSKVLAGLQCRHSPARAALIDKIRDGEMGEIPLIRANRLGGGGWMGSQGEKSNNFMDQLGFGRINLLWVGSGHMVDYLIHQIDECCWIKGEWPVSCVGFGGRHPHSTDHGQNIDIYSMEFTFADGTKAMCGFRRMADCRNEFATFIHGSKCAAQFSGQTHRDTVHMFKDQRISNDNIAWSPEKDIYYTHQIEWDNLIRNIREDREHNEIERAVYSDLTTLMGRAACHTGQEVTWDDMMNSSFQFCDHLDDLDYDSKAFVTADADGQFPVPVPGDAWKEI